MLSPGRGPGGAPDGRKSGCIKAGSHWPGANARTTWALAVVAIKPLNLRHRHPSAGPNLHAPPAPVRVIPDNLGAIALPVLDP